MEKLKITKANTIKTLYQLFYDVHRILKVHNLSYWMVGGTFLGAVRHEGIIPWDDDVDIGMDVRDRKKLMSLEKVFKKCGIKLFKFFFGFKLFYTNSKKVTGEGYRFPNLDIFLMENVDNSYYQYVSKEARKLWPKEYYEIEDLFPLKRYKFGSINVWGGYSFKKYLDRSFKGWKTTAYRQYDHEKEEEVEIVKVILTDKDRMPAQPTKVVKRKCIKSF